MRCCYDAHIQRDIAQVYSSKLVCYAEIYLLMHNPRKRILISSTNHKVEEIKINRKIYENLRFKDDY